MNWDVKLGDWLLSATPVGLLPVLRPYYLVVGSSPGPMLDKASDRDARLLYTVLINRPAFSLAPTTKLSQSERRSFTNYM